MSSERAAPPTVEEVTEVLSTVIDPELGSDVVSLGMIPRTEVSAEGQVVVEVRLTISGCPMRGRNQENGRAAPDGSSRGHQSQTRVV